MEPMLRTAQVLKQEAEDLGYEGKEILEYAKIEAEAEKKRADEIKIQMAQIEVDRELKIKELELHF